MNKPNYKSSRKYKCPYCDYKASRVDLVDHVEKHHKDLIPEQYTAARAIYDSINGKNYGICMSCKSKVYKWNDKINRYYNLCDNPECRKKVRDTALNRHMKVYNKPTLLNDAEHQEKMLANRRISGTYTFSDGKKFVYTGKYERNALEFMDKVLEIPSSDILTPGPVLEYEYEGKTHKWITDILYIPANLIIEIKDGGSNPNTRTMTSYRDKQVAKEVMITDRGVYNYLRLTNNDFSQLLDIFADMKNGALNNDTKARVHINESVIISNKDIYHNKDKFDSGDINLCFITGHSGSGKSTMGRDMQSEDIEHYEMDDVMTNYNFSDANLKEYGDLIYSYFKGPGKRFRYFSKDEYLKDKSYDGTDEYKNGYEALNTKAFVKHAINYAKSHKNTKFVLDGIWIYLFIDPSELDDFAVYVKGTSAIASAYRAARRDTVNMDHPDSKIGFIKGVAKKFTDRVSHKKYFKDEKILSKFRNYFKKLDTETHINESASSINDPSDVDQSLYFLSETNMDQKILEPRIPDNFLTANGYEDSTTPRVCFCTSIDNCLTAMSMRLTDKEFYIHHPVGKHNIYSPSLEEVPNVKITDEKWIKEPVKLICVGKVRVTGPTRGKGMDYTYGDNKVATLYRWSFENIDYKESGTMPKTANDTFKEEVGGLPPHRPPEAYMVPYGMNNVFDGFAYSDSDMNCMLLSDDLGTYPMDEEVFYETYNTAPRLYYTGSDIREKMNKIHNMIREGNIINKFSIPSILAGIDILRESDILFCECLKYYDAEQDELICSLIENAVRMHPTSINSNNVIKSIGNIYIHFSPENGYYATTPPDFHIASNCFKDYDSLERSNIINIMNDIYTANTSKSEVEQDA